MNSQQHKLCMIPGPIEFHEDVLSAMSVKSTSHVAPDFIEIFGDSLEKLRKVFLSSDAQPFILSGSGVLGWDTVASNLLEKDDRVLVLSTGVFGDRFAECLETYGAKATKLSSKLGDKHQLSDIENELKKQDYKMVTITQVDTSTGVLSDVKEISSLVRSILPEALIVVDGVCSAAAEELRFDEWGIDVIHTASQKAIGVPPGLCIFMISKKGIKRFESRKTPVPNYYCNLKSWIPIMNAYEARKPSYFGTPAVQLINALNVSLTQILSHGMEKVFETHRKVAKEFRSKIKALGLKTVTQSEDCAANTMTTIYYPEGIQGQELLKAISSDGVVLAGGLHPAISTKYFRIGHMGLSALDASRGHVDKVFEVLNSSLSKLGFQSNH
ncbi:PLP-dependent transferase [Neoconidiobolus thromboides FSU 785]|nr:PLP-dependent transferase [Neoconidiobolus thromboides FSU 785]